MLKENKNISEVELDENGLYFVFHAESGRIVACHIEYSEEDDELIVRDNGHECGRV